MKFYRIVHKDPSRHILFASGCWGIERAEAWVKNFDPQRYTDKTLRREDLKIEEETK